MNTFRPSRGGKGRTPPALFLHRPAPGAFFMILESDSFETLDGQGQKWRIHWQLKPVTIRHAGKELAARAYPIQRGDGRRFSYISSIVKEQNPDPAVRNLPRDLLLREDGTIAAAQDGLDGCLEFAEKLAEIW